MSRALILSVVVLLGFPAAAEDNNQQPNYQVPKGMKFSRRAVDEKGDGMPARGTQAGNEDVSECAFNKDAFAGSVGPYRTVKRGDRTWSYWSGDGQVVFCFFGNAFAQAGGYIADLKIVGEDLQVAMVGLEDHIVGLDEIKPEHVRNGKVGFIDSRGPVDLRLQSYTVYHIKLASLKEQQGDRHPDTLSELAWLVEQRNKIRPSQPVALQVFTEAEGTGRLARALGILRGGEDSGLFGGEGNAGNRAKLTKFAELSIAAQGPQPAEKAGRNRPYLKATLNLDDPAKSGVVADFRNWKQERASLKWIAPREGAPYLEEPK